MRFCLFCSSTKVRQSYSEKSQPLAKVKLIYISFVRYMVGLITRKTRLSKRRQPRHTQERKKTRKEYIENRHTHTHICIHNYTTFAQTNYRIHIEIICKFAIFYMEKIMGREGKELFNLFLP